MKATKETTAKPYKIPYGADPSFDPDANYVMTQPRKINGVRFDRGAILPKGLKPVLIMQLLQMQAIRVARPELVTATPASVTPNDQTQEALLDLGEDLGDDIVELDDPNADLGNETGTEIGFEGTVPQVPVRPPLATKTSTPSKGGKSK